MNPWNASVAAIRNGFFEGIRFFDTSGTEWRVESAVPQHRPGILDRVFNRTLTVDLQIGVQGSPAVADVAQDLCNCVDRDPDDLYDQFVSHIELKEMFRAAASAPELIELARTLGEASRIVRADPRAE